MLLRKLAIYEKIKGEIEKTKKERSVGETSV